MRTLATIGLAVLLIAGLSGCTRDQWAGALLGLGGHPEAALQLRQQRLHEQQQAIEREGAPRVFRTYGKVFEETGNVFEAKRQAKAEHALFLVQNPEIARRVDQFTALMWMLEGGEEADAVCYMRGFQFGTAHHNQCVYEVKMGRGDTPATATSPAPKLEGPSAANKSAAGSRGAC